MKFISKISFICNLCFLASAILRYVEMHQTVDAKNSDVLGFQPLTSTLVILGYGAIFVSFLFLIMFLSSFLRKKEISISPWLIVLNILFLLAQIIYFF